MTVRVAVVDSGIHAEHPHVGGIQGGVSFAGEGLADRIGHGTAVAAAIRDHAPHAELYAVRIFDRHLRTDIDTLVRGVQWCFDHGMHLVNLSVGTENEEHRDALSALVARGRAVWVLSAARTLPGSLSGVIAVDADRELARHQIRHQNGQFLASSFPRDIPGVPRERNLSGVSFAVANVTGIAARLLAQGAANVPEALLGYTRRKA